MLYLDHLAYHNRFARVSIAEKLLFGGGGLALALFTAKPQLSIAIILIMNTTILAANTPLGYLARLWLAPFGFLMAGLATVVISVSAQPIPGIYSWEFGLLHVGITEEGLVAAQALFLRSLAAVSCLLMVAATTPVAHVAAWLSRFRPLCGIMEITLLTYRFIFVMLSSAGQIYTAQQSRLGYCTWRRSLAAISMLAASIGRKAFLTARDLSVTLAARNYSDRLIYRYPPQIVDPVRLGGVILILSGLAAAGLV